jgi:hypothetical protein
MEQSLLSLQRVMKKLATLVLLFVPVGCGWFEHKITIVEYVGAGGVVLYDHTAHGAFAGCGISPHLPVGTVLFGQPWNEDTGTTVLRDVDGNRVTFEETYLGDESGDAADVVARKACN